MGSHSVRAGYELRYRRWDITNSGYGAGRYHFNGAYTRANNAAPVNDPAQTFAQFLLGLPTTASNTVANPGSTASQVEIAANGDYNQTSHGLFLQDDWRVNRKLTINVGVRLEVEQALQEAENENLGGFDVAAASPIEAAASARYAANPIPEIPVSEFRVKGGVLFADGAIYNTLVKPLPRGAFSYLIGERTVIRAGVGMFSYPYYFDAGNQAGFSQPTSVVSTLNNGTTFLTNLTDPVPTGTLIQPAGASLGLASSLGLTVGHGRSVRAQDALLRPLAGRLPARPGRGLGGGDAVRRIEGQPPARDARPERAAHRVPLDARPCATRPRKRT